MAKQVAELRGDFMRALRGIPASFAARALNDQTRGINWMGCSKADMADRYAKSVTEEAFGKNYKDLAAVDLTALAKRAKAYQDANTNRKLAREKLIEARKYAESEEGMFAKLHSFLDLKPAWDSYKAPPPSELAVRLAKQLAHESFAERPCVDRVAPSVIGGVGLHFGRGSRGIYVEIQNNGTVGMVYNRDHDPAGVEVFSRGESMTDILKLVRERLQRPWSEDEQA